MLRLAIPAVCLTLVLAMGCRGERPVSPAASQVDPEPARSAENDIAFRKDQATVVERGATLQTDANGRATAVDLSGVEVDDELAEVVGRLTSLQRLTLDKSQMTLQGWQALARLSDLSQLDVRHCPVDNRQLQAAVSGMSHLRVLRLNGSRGRTSVDDAGMRVLAGCPQLKVLAIDGLGISVQGLRQLESNRELTELYAGETLLDDSGVALLAEMPDLRKLRLSRTAISGEGLAALSRLELEDLDISECTQVIDADLAHLAGIRTLRRLNLWRDAIGDDGLVHLAGLTNLRWLNLDNTDITDAGLNRLAGLAQLEFLHLGSTSVTDQGMVELIPLKSLKDLKVTRTAVTERGAELLRMQIPEVEIQLVYVGSE